MLFSELDVRCEACQRFFKEGLMTSFVKILTDEAVSGWKMEIHVRITTTVLFMIGIVHCSYFFARIVRVIIMYTVTVKEFWKDMDKSLVAFFYGPQCTHVLFELHGHLYDCVYVCVTSVNLDSSQRAEKHCTNSTNRTVNTQYKM